MTKSRKQTGEETAKAVPTDRLPFEEALAGLERSVEMLKNERTTLANIVQSFEEGVAYYERCESILREAKQKIEVYGKDGF
ncbi:MAG: exodeoxyribonuclease VII small subunit [Clostridiales Family XIII bacterium]|jgi:exodeoxyribonuclease VII small subunit|nr:exodeoxyribonuclease VII small subunit [Clostridiales Family XIII bacterium]